jgi:flagellar biosynthetic protein FlhB
VLLGGLVFLAYAGHGIFEFLAREMRHQLTGTRPHDFSVAYVSTLAQSVSWRAAMALGPFLLTAVVLGIGANLLQGGVTLSWKSLAFNFEKLSPNNGISKIFSKNGTVELAKNLAILAVVSIISYNVVTEHLALYPRLVLMDVRQLMYWTGTISYQVCLRVGILLVFIALLDFAFQKYRFLEQMKMTKQEVKDEHKEMEGDPLTRARIRRIQRELSRKRMMADVPTADVVITNPTHYAVALSYKVDSMEAPKVVAKGVGFLALKIKELAQKHGVPTVENKPLAQSLYKTVEIGDYIPASLYKAVAEILAYIYKARNSFLR